MNRCRNLLGSYVRYQVALPETYASVHSPTIADQSVLETQTVQEMQKEKRVSFGDRKTKTRCVLLFLLGSHSGRVRVGLWMG